MSFEVQDPVSVQRDSGPQLEGIVAYVGDVSFDSAKDWVGVRLTGASVGMGKNDGTVQGEVYFSCPANCGIFVKVSALSKRNLSRLEQLRLRREIATSGGAPPTARAAAKTATTPARAATTATPAAASADATTTPEPKARETQLGKTPGDSSAKMTARSKIEEIRKRRMALQERKQEEKLMTPAKRSTGTTEEPATPPPPATAAPVAATPPPQAGIAQEEFDRIKQELSEWKEKFQEKEQQSAALQEQLSQAEQQLSKAEQQLSQAATNKEEPTKAPDLPSSSSSDLQDILQAKSDELLQLHRAHAELQDALQSALTKTRQLEQDVQRELTLKQTAQDEAVQARTQASTLQKELQALAEQSSADASHYKERAKLAAQVEAVKRRVTQLEAEKLDLEQTIEELALDKEQLLEEKEALEDIQEELKIDAETAQIQVDELRMELEDAQMAAERAATPSYSASNEATSMEDQDKAQALALQNARLREALIRLREQSSVEKMEIGRQLRAAEKQVETGNALKSEVEMLRAAKVNMEDQINHLKDMVEQSSAFESMVEDLSDRVLSLEEDNVMLQTTLREMEEAAELTAEMEEVQSDELKALALDLEGRDTIIRNLEEAIKMQRRREEDFRRTVGNYRATVETLKLEKQALLELQQGGEGEKNSLIASSQKALAKAAQLVADAAAMRKREALAVMDKIDHQIYRHLSTRLEALLPPSSVAEISSIKGELLTSKVVSKAAQSLNAIAQSFGGSIRPPIPPESSSSAETDSVALSDETKAEVTAMFHQTDFAHDIAGVSSNLLRYLVAGQWPDLLSPEASTELGSLLGHSLAELDNALGHVLLSLKEEGSLTPEQSNIDRLRQSSRNTIEHLESDMVREDGPLVPQEWVPPGLELLRETTLSKFSCMGAAAALSIAVHSTGVPASWSELYNKVEQCSSQSSTVCLRLASMDVKNSKLVEELGEIASVVKKDSSALLQEVKNLVEGENANLTASATTCETLLRSLAKLSAMLRSANLQLHEDGSHHAFSPEAEDTWARLSGTLRALQAIDGDGEDVNYLFRARQVEHQLATAVENEPKLETAQAKIATLEKNLASRSKEISMQNARLSELERLLAKSAINTGRSIPTDFKSSKEYNMLMEENRVLMEAMDVLQVQVDEYEQEIRVLKDFKAPRRGAQGSSRTPRRALTSVSDLAAPKVDLEEALSTGISLEATLFRPALQQALRESWKWKAAATSSAMSNLPPLLGPFLQETGREDDLKQLTAALTNVRMKKASVKLVDLSNRQKPPRTQLIESRAACREATRELETLALRFRGRMTT